MDSRCYWGRRWPKWSKGVRRDPRCIDLDIDLTWVIGLYMIFIYMMISGSHLLDLSIKSYARFLGQEHLVTISDVLRVRLYWICWDILGCSCPVGSGWRGADRVEVVGWFCRRRFRGSSRFWNIRSRRLLRPWICAWLLCMFLLGRLASYELELIRVWLFYLKAARHPR